MTSAVVTPPAETQVNVAAFAVARETGILSSVGLGSCIAIILWEEVTRTGAMAHILLPHEALSRDRGHPAKFASTAIPLLIDELRLAGARTAPVAKLVGGASMFGALLSSGGGVNMGERNIVASRRAVAAAGLSLVAEDVGGDYGRSVHFDVSTGRVRVTSIRHGSREL